MELSNSRRIDSRVLHGHFVSLSSQTGKQSGVRELIGKLAKLNLDQTLQKIVFVLQQLDAYSSNPRELQPKLINAYLSYEKKAQLRNFLATESSGIVFHRQAIWLVLQVAVLSCSHKDSSDQRKNHELFGDCVLIANEILNHDTIAWPADKASQSDINDAITVNLLPVMETSRSNGDIFEIAVFKKLWKQIPQSEAFSKQTRSIPEGTLWHETFKQKFGIDFNDFTTVSTLCISFFLSDGTQKEAKRMDVNKYFGTGAFRKTVDDVLMLLSQSPEELAFELISRPRQSWLHDLTALKRRPLLRLDGGFLVCPEFSFLVNVLRDGVYWLLLEAFSTNGNKFQQCFGYAFELFVEEQLSSIAYNGEQLLRELFPSPRFEGTQDQAGDFLISWETCSLVIECKASLLSRHQKYGGDQANLMKGIDDNFASKKKGVGQLSSCISRLLKGERVLLQGKPISIETAKPLIPVLITYESTVGFNLVRNRLQRKFEELIDGEELERSQVQPLIVLTIDDLRLLQGLSNGLPARELLLKFAQELKVSNDSLGSFSTFIEANYPDSRLSDDSSVRQECLALLSEVEADYKTQLKKKAASENAGGAESSATSSLEAREETQSL